MSATGDLLGVDEVARMLGKSRPTVLRLTRAGDLPHAYKSPGIRGPYLFSRPVVEMYLRTKKGDTP